MATQKDLLKTAIVFGAVEGMSVTGEYIDVTVPNTLTPSGTSAISPIAGYCALRAISTKGVESGGYPWLSVDSREAVSNINGSWLAGGGATTTIPVAKGATVHVCGSEAEVKFLRFIKVIGGGYKRYLPSLSRNRFGGALWLRLKTTSETLRRLEAGSRSRLGVLSCLKPLEQRQLLAKENTFRQPTGISRFILMRLAVRQSRLTHITRASNCRRTIQANGLDAVSLARRGQNASTASSERGSFKGKRYLFIPKVASNNARMEVAA